MRQDIWLSGREDLLTGIMQGRVGVWRWRIGTGEVAWSKNLEEIHDMPKGSFDGSFDSFGRDVDEQDEPGVRRAIEATLATGTPYKVTYRCRNGAGSIWIEARGGLVADEHGGRYLTGICQDVTEKVEAQRELARRLRQQEGVQRLGSFALGEAELVEVMDLACVTAAEVLDVPLAKILEFSDSADHLLLRAGVGWEDGLVDKAIVPIDADSQAGFTLSVKEPVVVDDLATETRFSGPELLHRHGVRSGMSCVIPGPRSRPFGVFGVHAREPRHFDHHDVAFLVSLANIVSSAARQRASMREQQLLLREMAHRSGNLLQVVSSLAAQTLRTHDDRDVALRSFNSRLEALSRASYLIARGGWTPTRLRSLAEECLTPFKGKVRMEGRDILLPADLAFDVALVLHELATNSAKYGSLAREDGEVALVWELAPDDGGRPRLNFSWTDAAPLGVYRNGGGFGSRLKRTLVEKKWNGRMNIELGDKYRFEATIPMPG